MGRIQKWAGCVFLFAMLILGEVQIAEGNTNNGSMVGVEQLYSYQSFSGNDNAQQFYIDLDQVISAFEEEGEDAHAIMGGANYLAGKVNYKDYGLTVEEAKKVYHYYRYDHPEYYWISTSFAYNDQELIVLVDPLYKDADMRAVYNQKRDVLITYVLAYSENMTPDEKVSYLHDLIISATWYAYYPGTKTPVEEGWAHCITGYLDGKGVVCEGYAKTMQLLLNAMGIENIFVTGLSRGESHAWNLIKMEDGDWYWFDLTWDDRDLENPNANRVYYAMPDSLFKADHVPYTENSNDGRDRSLYALPQASDAYDYYCSTGVKTLQNATASQMISALQNGILTEIKAGGNCAIFNFPTDADYEAFSNRMFTGFVKQDGTPFYYYEMYLDQVPELKKSLSNQFSFQLIGNYLYFYFDYAKDKVLPAVTVYANNQAIGSFGTLQEAFSKMTNANADYEIIYNSWEPMQMLPADVALPKVRSIGFYGSEVQNGQVSFLFLPKDLTLNCNVTFKNMCLMGINEASTNLNLNGYTMKAIGSYVYIGNTGNTTKQAVKLNGSKGELFVDAGTQLFAVEPVNVDKLTLQGGAAGSWVYLRAGGTIDTYKGIDVNGYLIVNENPISIKTAQGKGYIYPNGKLAYKCTVGTIAEDATIGFILYPQTETQIRIENEINGTALAMYDVAGEPESNYMNYTKKKHIYAPKATDDQIWCLVKKQTNFEYSNWALEKQSDSSFCIVLMEKDASGNYVKVDSQTVNTSNNKTPGQAADSVAIPGSDNNTSGNKNNSSSNGQKGTLAVGTKKTDKTGVTYKVVASQNGTACVAYTAPKKGVKGKITVPDSVVIDGKTYLVVEIANKAFKKNKNIKEIKIGVNVTKIGKEAFSGCSKLKKITIRSTKLTSVGKNACKGIYKKAVIKVPKAKVKDYTKLFKKKGQSKTVKVKK